MSSAAPFAPVTSSSFRELCGLDLGAASGGRGKNLIVLSFRAELSSAQGAGWLDGTC